MNKLLSILFALCVSAQAGDVITATVIVTNAANLNGTNAASLTHNGLTSTRIWTNSVTSASTQIKASTNTTTAAFNLFQHLKTGAYPFTGVQTLATNNGVVLIGAEGAALSLTVSNSWASVSYRTNTFGTSYGVVSVPYTIFAVQEQNRLSDGLVSWLNIAPTNAITATAPVAANLVGLANTQTITGAKALTNLNNTLKGATLETTGNGVVGGTLVSTGAVTMQSTADITGALTASASLNLGTYMQMSHAALTADSEATNFVANFTGQPYRTITAVANVNFIQSTNRAAVRSMVIFVDANGTNRTLSVNSSWRKLNTFDTTVTNGTVGIISLTTKGTAETDVYASYAVTQ